MGPTPRRFCLVFALAVAMVPAPGKAQSQSDSVDRGGVPDVVRIFIVIETLANTGAIVSSGFAIRDLHRGYRTNMGAGVAANIFGGVSVLLGALGVAITTHGLDDHSSTAAFGGNLAVLAVGVTSIVLGTCDLVLPRASRPVSLRVVPMIRRDGALIGVGGSF